MRIAILGTRGIPANYGGFETFAEELSTHLVKRGHDVTVYGRSHYISKNQKFYKGVRVIVTQGVRHKYFDTPFNTILSTIHAFLKKYDVVLYCNSANVLFTLPFRLKSTPVVLNVDGLEWKREKWGKFGRAVYRISEFLSTFVPDFIVTDAKEVCSYYKRKFNKSSLLIPYGAHIGRESSTEALDRFGVMPGKYLLYVSRLEPENNAHVVVEAFEKVNTDYKLIIVGDAPYSTEYIKRLKSTKDKRIIFTGYVFGKGYREFQSHAFAYIQATEAGGTQPALVEAMGRGSFILANDVVQHREVLGETGVYFNVSSVETLTQKMQYYIDHPEEADHLRSAVVKRVKEKYSWDAVTSQYETLFKRITGRRT
ncbi:DUF1972 domain-containing protein [bacterium]|nr:DUF1972 domain-containing protein [bacterium]